MFLSRFIPSCQVWFWLSFPPSWFLYDLQQYNWNYRIWILSIHWTLQYCFCRLCILHSDAKYNVSFLNEFICGLLNREGTLCGKCKSGYGIALYSYTLECSKCWGRGYGWVLYYFLELFPITLMYFLVVIFHIRATSSPLSTLVFMSQIVVYTVHLSVPFHMYIENEVTGFLYVALKVLLVLCGIWSLDFFRAVILCKQQHQNCSCTCTWVSCSILSHHSYFTHLCVYKTLWQQL